MTKGLLSHLNIRALQQHFGGKRSELLKMEREYKFITEPPAASNIVTFSEIFRRFRLASDLTRALTDGTTRIYLLTLSVTSVEYYKTLKVCRKIDYDLKSFQPESTAFGPDHLTAVTRHIMD